MLTTPIFTRVMTEAEYGRYSVYSSWFSILQIIVSLNLAAGVYTKGLVKNEEDEDRFSSSMLGLSTVCILIWCIVYAFFHDLFNQWLGLTTLLMIALLVDVWATAVFQFWSNRERVHYRYIKLVALTLTSVFLRPVLGVVFVMSANVQYQVEARVITTVLVNLLLFSTLYVVIMRKGKCFFHREYWLYALKFNIPLVPHYLSQTVLSQSDKLMINSMCGPSETAYYSVAYTLAMVLQILNTSISSTMNPWIYQSIKKNELQKIGKVSYTVLLLIALMNFAVVLSAPELLRILAPSSYQAAIWVVPPVTVSVFFMFLYNLFATFEYYYEKTHYVALATVLGAALNVVLNAVCIPRFGFVAAGYTTLACYILYAMAHYMFMRKVNRKCMNDVKVYNLKVIIGIGVLLIISALLVMMLYNFPIVRYGMLLLIVIVVFIKRKTLTRLFQTLLNKSG